MEDIVIVSAARTAAVGKFGGSLAKTPGNPGRHRDP